MSVVYSFIQLDLGLLRIKNTVVWHGCPENDPSAVHLDVLDAEVNKLFQSFRFSVWLLSLIRFSNIQILGINMAVGIDGSLGKPMIREGREVHVFVRRSLRDVFRKVPTISLGVKVICLFQLLVLILCRHCCSPWKIILLITFIALMLFSILYF